LRGGGLKTLLEVLQSARFASSVRRLPGYDSSQTSQFEPLDTALTWVEQPRKPSHA
jgi:hypothetical protein